MANNSNKFYTEKKYYTIYALVDKMTKKFLIGYCMANNVVNNYSRHYTGQVPKTEKWIQDLKQNNSRPCLFPLETIHGTKAESYARVVVWTRIFLDNGYQPIDSGLTIEYANYLTEENLVIYEEKKRIELREILKCEHCQFPKYNNEICVNFPVQQEISKIDHKIKSTQKQRIQVRVKPEEYCRIKSIADSFGLDMSTYIKNLALDGIIVRYDHRFLLEYSRRLHDYRKAINLLIASILNTGDYYSADIKMILEQQQKIMEDQNEIYKKIRIENKKIDEKKFEKYIALIDKFTQKKY